MAVKPVPDGYHTVTPYLVVQGVDRLLGFLAEAFGAEADVCHRTEAGLVMHAEVRIGDSRVMIGEAHGPHEPRPGTLYLYVPDVDSLYRRAVAAGGVSLMEPANMFYGDRNAGVKDPCGNQWWIGSRVEEITPEEMRRRSIENDRKRAAK